SAGLLLLLATLVAFAISNSALAAAFETFWETPFRLAFGNAVFELTLREWIDDALLSVFFLVVGLEIKRELTVGHLARRTSAALPIAAAVGGMVVPALLYVLFVPARSEEHTSELQSRENLVCRLLLEKKKNTRRITRY